MVESPDKTFFKSFLSTSVQCTSNAFSMGIQIFTVGALLVADIAGFDRRESALEKETRHLHFLNWFSFND